MYNSAEVLFYSIRVYLLQKKYTEIFSLYHITLEFNVKGCLIARTIFYLQETLKEFLAYFSWFITFGSLSKSDRSWSIGTSE